MFDLEFLIAHLPVLLSATGVTILITVLGMALSLCLGLVLAVVQLYAAWPIARLAYVLAQCVRVSPLLIQIYFVFYVLPFYGLTLPPFLTAVLIIGTHYGTYASEIYKAGIRSIPRSQHDAVVALNIPRWRAWWRILLPQAVIPMIPAFGNCAIAMLKESPLLSVITIPELVGVGRQLAFETFKYTEVFTALGLIFLVLSSLYSVLTRWIERVTRVPA
ncbi:amino acid ABC transporter permease [Acuticoccus mangrovi]|uniref:ABC transporter permease subunit n=1 Tax=Acuticoccus mangrovi TaxID=2796142 RepID=A0A934IEV3_9HYPH|nr:ABC transporter permease subunit [Acuticoccus mangrovi]MBJ3775324.1 ABC transporter permease subunit [Acuticoccus mangrovi]